MWMSRREFLKSGASVVAIGAAVPPMLMNIAHARAAEGKSSASEKILVVFELNGGNDGLNTVIPITDPLYAAYRPTLAVPREQGLMLDDKAALHPSMTGFADLYKHKQLAVIQGAGYPNTNRSHFRSMEIWHRGDPGNQFTTGWLGRYYEKALAEANKSVVPVVHYGQKRPELFKAGRAPAISINAVDDFYPMNQKPESVAVSTLYKDMRVKGPADRPAEMAGHETAGHGADGAALSPGEIIQTTGLDIVKGTEVIKGILNNPRQPKAIYPTTGAGKGLAIFAQMIVQNTGTRLFYISLGGFDTHAKQAEGHAKLLATMSDAISAFLADLKAESRDKDVLVMSFSEFGRRTRENNSNGTDHGAASIMFFAGGAVKGGLYGDYPSLEKLDDGDLKYNVDFRDCYATVLESWLGTAPDRILPKAERRVGFL